jgi:hypothetical protein
VSWRRSRRRVFLDNAAKQLTSANSLKEMPDLVDATHFRDAAYADVLGTRDRRLAEVGRAARVLLQIVDFLQFAGQVQACATR